MQYYGTTLQNVNKKSLGLGGRSVGNSGGGGEKLRVLLEKPATIGRVRRMGRDVSGDPESSYAP
jgi:hypothetical protein